MAGPLLAKDILKRIVVENVPFSLALKQAFKHNDVSKEDRQLVSAVVGCALRHYIVMERVLKTAYPELESEALTALLIAFSNALFIKKFNQDECNTLAQSFIKADDTPFDNFLSPYLEDKKLVPEDVEVGSFEFLSCRYNAPASIIKMWNKQFGQITTSRILKANSKPAPTVLRINNVKISDEDFFNQYPEYEKTDIPGIAIYNGEGRFKNSAVAEQQIAAALSPIYKFALDKGDTDLLRGFAVYSEYQNDLLIELMSRFENINNIEYVAGSYGAFISTKNSLSKANIKGVNVYEAASSSIVTCISKPVHTFLVMPESSRLNLLQVLPDYFLRFDIQKLDELIANQIKALNEASNQVEDGGYLLYMVDTISKKETTGIINDFLRDHSNFSLVEDKQFFPYKKFGGSYYFAVLQKGANA
ncbi:MAG: hypothetical protein MJ216_01925 [Bacilli bacterium]|nr:hypothetical protein [Bacilli bacterium]